MDTTRYVRISSKNGCVGEKQQSRFSIQAKGFPSVGVEFDPLYGKHAGDQPDVAALVSLVSIQP